jgi:hypothetical protein
MPALLSMRSGCARVASAKRQEVPNGMPSWSPGSVHQRSGPGFVTFVTSLVAPEQEQGIPASARVWARAGAVPTTAACPRARGHPRGAPGSPLLSRHAGRCGEAAKQPMRDPKEIRKLIAYAERRIRERQAEANATRRKAKRARRLGIQDGRPLCGAPTRNGSPCRRWAQPPMPDTRHDLLIGC